jgi:hypothetical protein
VYAGGALRFVNLEEVVIVVVWLVLACSAPCNLAGQVESDYSLDIVCSSHWSFRLFF